MENYKISDCVYGIRNALKNKTDDSFLSNRSLYRTYKNFRNILLKRENDKGKLFQSGAEQVISIEFEDSDLTEYCGDNLGCKISKSKYRIPKILDTTLNKRAMEIFTLDGGTPIEIKTLTDIKRRTRRRFNYKYSLLGFIHNDYLYITEQGIKAVTIKGIFEDPEEATILNNCDCCPTCLLYMDLEIYTPGYLRSSIEQMAVDYILKSNQMIIQDKENNAVDDGSK